MILRQPSRRALLAFALFAVASAAVPQVYFVPPRNAEAEAAARRKLRRVEAKLGRGLERSHGDPTEGARLGEALRVNEHARLDHPSSTVRAALVKARDPAALALAIAGDAGDTVDTAVTYETDVLLTALSLTAASSRRGELWAKAAEVERRGDPVLRIAFLERAYESLSEPGGGPVAGSASAPPVGAPARKPADAFSVASEELDDLLAYGLAREAVAAFDAWPPELRERLVAEGGGTSVAGFIRPDQLLSLAAARLLTGDMEGARALLTRAPLAAWRPADGNLTDASRPDPMAVFRAMLERSLAPAGAEDPFPVLAEFAASDLFGPGTAVWGVGVTAYARLAEREGYPAIAAFAWRKAPGQGNPVPTEPALLPAAAAQTVRRLRAALAEESRLAGAAMKAGYHAAGEQPPRPIVKSSRDGSRLDQMPLSLFVVDRDGHLGLVMIDNPPYYGELYRVEPHDDGLVGVLFSSWIS